MISLSKKKKKKTNVQIENAAERIYEVQNHTEMLYILHLSTRGKGVKNLSRRIGKGWSNRLTKSE